jgi:hypothetical protein
MWSAPTTCAPDRERDVQPSRDGGQICVRSPLLRLPRGTTSQVQIHSDPPEAQARTSMGYACITPCTLQANRKDEFSVIIAKAGYRTVEIPVRTQIAGAGAAGFAGNVILGGVVGMAADAATGATLEHFPNPVTVRLTPLKKANQIQ